jgi:outer membrane murein-binding lipoprotein Lpp
MSKELKILTIASLIFLSLFAYGSMKKEYARITTRVETTQAKVDSLADELQATTATIHAAIKSITDRFLTVELEVDEDEQLADEGLFGAARSSKWSAVRRAFLKIHPECEACGSRDELNVHHIKPFNVAPELELDPTNLITLCRKHHFEVGHLGNWRSANATVRQDAAKIRIGLGRQITIPVQPTILMHSGYNCGPCSAWIATRMPAYKQQGWRVQVVKETDTNRPWPWYEVTDADGVQFQVDGPLDNAKFKAAKARAK